MKQEDVNIEVVSIDDLIQDDHNFNKGNEQGAQLLERSFRECGAGRSVLIDKDNRLVEVHLSVPDKRDCGVSLRAKRTRISRIERINLSG